MSKIEAFWQPATADDVAEIIKTGKPIPARVRNEDDDSWRDDAFLWGWIDGNWAARGAYWTFCQVYRELSWYANKPDPGPGYRLLEKFPDEPKLATDEAWDCHSKEWRRTFANDGDQVKTVWYRRRSEPVEPKFAVGQTVKVVGPKATDAKHWDSEMARHVGTLQTIKYIEGFANPPEIFYGVYGIDSRKFREDYLEPVEPEPVEAPNTYHYTNPGDVVHCPNGTVIVIGSKGFEVTQ